MNFEFWPLIVTKSCIFFLFLAFSHKTLHKNTSFNVNTTIQWTWWRAGNTIVGYKKCWKSNSISFWKGFEMTYKQFPLLHHVHWVVGFTLNEVFYVMFCAVKLEKKKKIPFLITKRGQNSKSVSFLKTLDVNCMEVLTLSFTSTHFGRIYSQKSIFL